MGEVKELDQENFDAALETARGKLVVVEFYTRTCPICAGLVPVYEEVAGQLRQDARFYRVDATANQALSMRYGIMGVPAFKFFCKGREIAGTVGETNVTALANTVKDLIRRGSECVSNSTILRYEMDGYG